MNNINKLKVLYYGTMVGTLAKLDRNLTAFEYDKQWLNEGFSISPFSLPLEKKVFEAKIEPFGGIFGVFADSLPDGWGRILMDRVLRILDVSSYMHAGNVNKYAALTGAVVKKDRGYCVPTIPAGGISLVFNELYAHYGTCDYIFCCGFLRCGCHCGSFGGNHSFGFCR